MELAMNSTSNVRKLLYLAVFVLYVMHNDLWLWHDPSIVMGLPIGLLYHVAYCAAAIVMMILLVNLAWPTQYDEDEEVTT
jgi:hypothetical protein